MIKNNNDFLDGAIFWLVGWFEILRQKFFAIGGGVGATMDITKNKDPEN